MEYALAISAAILAVVAAWWLLGGRVKRSVEVPDGWHIGPIIGGKNYSHCDFAVTSTGWKARLGPGDELDAVLKPCEGISGSLTFTYRVTGEIASAHGGNPRACLYFQLPGDDWSKNQTDWEWKRWYSRERFPLTPGEHKVSIPLSVEYWKGVNVAPKPDEEHHFRPDLAVMFGMGFGGIDGPIGEGAMHGITGTGTIEMTGE